MGEKEDFAIMIITFLCTVVMGVIQGIGLGMDAPSFPNPLGSLMSRRCRPVRDVHGETVCVPKNPHTWANTKLRCVPVCVLLRI